MAGPVVEIDGGAICDWASFHDEFTMKLGFADSYGRNMSAWIDCMTYLDEPDGMRAISITPGQVLTLRVMNHSVMKQRCPEIAEALHESVSFVNDRRVADGQSAVLALSYDT